MANLVRGFTRRNRLNGTKQWKLITLKETMSNFICIAIHKFSTKVDDIWHYSYIFSVDLCKGFGVLMSLRSHLISIYSVQIARKRSTLSTRPIRQTTTVEQLGYAWSYVIFHSLCLGTPRWVFNFFFDDFKPNARPIECCELSRGLSRLHLLCRRSYSIFRIKPNRKTWQRTIRQKDEQSSRCQIANKTAMTKNINDAVITVPVIK